MKTIGGAAPVRSSCSCSSNPLRPVRLTSSTRHLALARCSEARNSSAEPKASTANASAQRSRRSARSTDRSSSITQINEGIVNTMDCCPSFDHPLLVPSCLPSHPAPAMVGMHHARGHVGVGRRAVEIEVVFLDVLAVIALAVGEAEQALLHDGIDAVPEGQREAEPLLIVGDPGQAVLAPAVRARAGLIVAEVVPGVAALAVVLAH